MTTYTQIYHYTTVLGLIGIITHHQLWASDCRFLNDGTELSYARDLFYAEVSKLNLTPLQESGRVVAGQSPLSFPGLRRSLV